MLKLELTTSPTLGPTLPRLRMLKPCADRTLPSGLRRSRSEELDSLARLGTWEVVQGLPAGAKALNHKWVHKVKFEDGKPVRYKSRLTVMGCAQREGIDFTETFSPVARLANLRLILALGVTEGFHYWQLDVSNVFPNANVEEVIFMRPPKELRLPANSFLRLLKALYGLKQASHMWHNLVSSILVAHLFKKLQTDSCIFIHRWDAGRVIIIVLYVEDIVIAATHKEDIINIVAIIESHFKITQRPMEFVLGVKVSDSRAVDGCIRLDLNAYTRMVLDRHADLLRSLARSTLSFYSTRSRHATKQGNATTNSGRS